MLNSQLLHQQRFLKEKIRTWARVKLRNQRYIGHWLLDLALEETHKGNRPNKAFNVVAWDNIIKAFNERTFLQYENL